MAELTELLETITTRPLTDTHTQFSNQSGIHDACSGPVPSARQFFAVTGTAGISLISLGTLFFVVTAALFWDTLVHVVRRTPGPAKTHTAFIICVYPAVSLCSLVALAVPRSQLITEAAAQAVLMAAMYQLMCLFIDYCGGESEIVRSLTAAEQGTTPKISLRVAPCCWPCLPLPEMPLTKKNFVFLRILVLQLPIVQNLIYFTLLVASADTEGLGERLVIPMVAPILISILLGIWGLKATLTSLTPLLDNPEREHSGFRKFVALQLVLFLTKLQGAIIKGAASAGWLPCGILPRIVLADVLYNTALIVEMCLLMIVARYLYKKESLQNGDPEARKTEIIRTISATEKVSPQTDNNNTIAKMCHRF